MPRNVVPYILVPLEGLSDQVITDGKHLGEETLNFYPDGEGYLVNYPGRSDRFRRPPPELPATVGTPPAKSGTYTRIHIYRDALGEEHIVFVKDTDLCVVEGNGFRVLYSFVGSTVDGVCWPTIFTHENSLIILNQGDYPLRWNGFEDVVPLGIHEILPPPEITVHEDPLIRTFNGAGWPWMPDPDAEYGWWSLPGVWPPGEPPDNNLGNQEDADSDPIPGFYAWWAVPFDDFGNRGVPSPVSEVAFVGIDQESSNVNAGFPDIKHWATVKWTNPKTDWHIAGVEVYRSLNLHNTTGNTIDVAYRDWIQNNIVGSRYTARRSDGDIANDLLLDRNILPPKSTNLGASFGQRIVLRDPDQRNISWFSDEVFTGQYRTSNQYLSKDDVEAYVPIGDRLMIVTHSTCEILYYDNSGNVRYLETYDNKGSYYGRTFATFGNVAFGFFHDGFFMFDGAKFAKVPTPYYIEPNFIDRYHEVQKAVIQGDWYRLAIRKDAQDVDNNVIIMCHLPTQRWFIVEETANDLVVYNEYILGVDDSIYYLYNGNTYAESVLHLEGILPQGKSINDHRVLTQLSLLVDPQSNANIAIEVAGNDRWDTVDGSGISYPRVNLYGEGVKNHYNKSGLTWEDNPSWISPNDVWLLMSLNDTKSGFKHSIEMTFDAGLPQRVKGLQLAFSGGEDDADKK